MKRVWQVLMLSVLVVGLVPASWLLAQHQQHHTQAPAAEPQKPAGMEMCPMAAMMAQRPKMEKLIADLVESFDKARTLEEPGQRQAAMEEHARLLTELRDSFQQHHAAMAEQMKMCPMMQKSTNHQEHPQEKK